jgi:SAM-dependent methyltransferase
VFSQILNASIQSVEGYFSILRVAGVYVSLVDKTLSSLAQQGPIPPFHLRTRVHGSPGLREFLEVGHRCAQDLQRALNAVGRDVARFHDILDFGCGCGRTLRWMPSFAPNAEAVAWVTKHLPFVSAAQNPTKDRLRYLNDAFDLIYAISVFTHMDEEHQSYWLGELRRVLGPGGILLVTLHGRNRWRDLSPSDVQTVQEKGMVVVRTRMWGGIFPEWYHNTYHSKEYVLETFGAHFDVLAYLPVALDSNHDIVVLQKKS